MAFDDLANFAHTSVATAPTPATSGTSLTLSAGGGALMPAVPFNAVIRPSSLLPLKTNSEIVRVTALVGDIATIVRAQEGSTARAVQVGDFFEASPTKKTFTDLYAAIGSPLNVSAGTTSNLLSALTFSNLNGISFGLDASTITASHNALTSQSNQAVSAANGSVTFQTLSFSNANGVSFLTAAGPALQASVASSLTNVNISAGTTSNNLSALTFGNANGVTFGLDASTLTASVLAQSNQSGGVYVLGNTTGESSSSTFDARSLSIDAAGNLSAGWSNGSLRLSGSQSNQAFSAQGGSSAFQTLSFTNSFGVSFTNTNGSVAASIATSLTNINLSAGTTSQNLSAFVLSNANNVSFGLNGSTVTATATIAQSNQTAGIYAVGNTTGQSSSSTYDARTLSIDGGGIVSVGWSNGTLRISATAAGAAPQTGISGIVVSDTTYTSGTVSFSNAGNITISSSVNGATQYIRLSGNAAQTAQSAIKAFGASNTGNTAGNTGISTGIDWVLAGSNNITISESTVGGGPNTLWVSGPSVAGAQTGISGIVVSDTTYTSGTVSFSNAGNVTISSSVNGATQFIRLSVASSLTNVNLSAGTTSNDLSAFVFSNANNVSFGLNGSTVTATATIATSLSNIRVSAGTTSNLLSALTFSDANGLAFGLNASTITGSYTVPTVTNSSWTVSDNATSGTVARLAFTNLNGVTLSLSTGAGGSHTIVGSHNALTSQSTQFLAVTLGGNTSGTTTFHASNNASIFLHGGNNITVSGNGSSITISGPNVAGAQTGISGLVVSDATYTSGTVSFSNAGNVTISSSVNGATQYIRLSVASQSNQTLGLYATGTTDGQSSSSTFDARSVTFSGFGPMSLGFSGGSMLVSLAGALYAPMYANLGGV